MSDEKAELFEDHILAHVESPYHRGRLPHPTYTHRERIPSCGDDVELQLQVDGTGRITQAFFDGRGCFVSQGAASILCQFIEGKELEQLALFEAHEMLDLLGVPLTPTRQQCGLLAFKALKTIVYSVQNSVP